jgi:hypothetical protein
LEEECGLRPYQPIRAPNYCDPDYASCTLQQYNIVDHAVSALIFGLSAAGRWYAPKQGVTRIPFTISMLLVPVFYFLSINLKEKRFTYTSSERRSFEQNLEFYPVTRRAWNRAMAIYQSESK